jgi:pilus assembly protein CpaF
MAGFLNQLKRKTQKGGTVASDLLLRSSSAHIPNPMMSPTKPNRETSNDPLSEADALLAELQLEGKAKPQAPAPRPSGSMNAELNATAHRTKTMIASNSSTNTTRVRVVRHGQTEIAKKRKKDILDDSLPWWLTDPVAASPQVDILVPASRRVLNELISDGVRKEDIPQYIQRAVSLAAQKLQGEVRFSPRDMSDAQHELTSLMLGKGPLQPLYDDPAVSDIHVDGYCQIRCVRRGQALETPFKFRSPEEYESYLSSMLQSVDRVLNMSSPIVDCVLGDEYRSRINAVHASLRDGGESSIVIRVPRMKAITFYDLLQTKTLPANLAAWLAELVACGHANILVLGPTGSGKTTFTTAMLSAVGSDERICTIEDVPEVFVPTVHIEKLVCRPENSQGEGAVDMHQLLRAALRRAPHRIVVGEIRDKEGPLFLKALETGHAGSVATIHAENPRDGLWRLLDVVAAYESAPQESIQRRIARSLHIMISMKKVGGRPCLTDVSEVRPPINGEFVVTQIAKFETDDGGRRTWRIMANHSEWLDHLVKRGMELTPGPGLLPMEKIQDKTREVG